MGEPGPVLGGDGAGLSSSMSDNLRPRAVFSGVPARMELPGEGIFRGGLARPDLPPSVHRGRVLRDLPQNQKAFTWLYEAALPYVEAVIYRTDPFPRAQELQRPGWQSAPSSPNFTTHLLADVFPVGSAGFTAPHLADAGNMLHFSAALPHEALLQHSAAEDDIPGAAVYHLPALPVQRNLAVSSPAGPPLLFPASDDPDPEHLKAESWPSSIPDDRFIASPKARLRGCAKPNIYARDCPHGQTSSKPPSAGLFSTLLHSRGSGRSHPVPSRSPGTDFHGCFARVDDAFRRPAPAPPCRPLVQNPPQLLASSKFMFGIVFPLSRGRGGAFF